MARPRKNTETVEPVAAAPERYTIGAYVISKPVEQWVVFLGGNVIYTHPTLEGAKEYVARLSGK